MKKLWLVLLVSIFAVSVNAKEMKIGVIDIQKLMQSNPELQGINKKLESQFTARRDELMKEQETLQKEVDKGQRDSAVMGDSEKEKLLAQLDQKRRDLARKQQTFQEDLVTAQQQAMRDLLKEVQKCVKTVAVRDHFDLVLQKESLPYSVDNLDITEDVLKVLKG